MTEPAITETSGRPGPGHARSTETPGERQWVPTVAYALRHIPAHMARYRLARRYVPGRRVCDIACGAGYGSHFLSQVARQVVGMDVSREAIDWATGHFTAPNLRYLQAAGDAPWPLEDSFDVVVSFETMEHTTAPERFLQSIHEHVVPGGTLILSVPNGPRDQAGRPNPFHLHAFTSDWLHRLLESHFSPVEYFSQVYRKDWRHYLARRFRKLMRYHSHRVDNYTFEPGLHPDVQTWLAIAVKPGEQK
jgi:2-polyprenyl-3-methyl-5-hydroxy-6-metoxy-1,4-benzoquinol methylase